MHGPEYRFLLSAVGGEHRFAAAAARRLQLLGALTQVPATTMHLFLFLCYQYLCAYVDLLASFTCQEVFEERPSLFHTLAQLQYLVLFPFVCRIVC